MTWRSKVGLALGVIAVATWVVAVRPVSPAPSPPSFLGYRTRPTKKTAKFTKILGVQLSGGFADGRFDLTAAGDFLVATGVGGTVAERTHLRAYKLKPVKGAPKPVKQLAVPVMDGVGTFRLVDATKPDLLLVPTAEDPTSVPAPPDPNDPVDHYECWRIAITKKTPKLPKGLKTSVTDPFSGVAKMFDVRAFKHLCLPVDRDGSGVPGPGPDLACYGVAAAKGQPKHIPALALQLNNALGALVVDTTKESELCVPATRPSPTPTPAASAGQPTPTRTATPTGPVTPTPLSTVPPGDPASTAPALAKGVVTIPALATSFLYTGADPIQTGVAPGTIDAKRAAVLRGRVVTAAGVPIAGVTVGVHDHPELGTTRTRVDGAYDLAVNGGGPLTLELRKDGLVPAGRLIDVPWQDFVVVPDVVMVAFDPVVTAITFGANAPFQTATSSTRADTDGARTSLLLFPAGASASLVFADGRVEPAATLHVRATEFTVGSSGPAAMPAVLPPLSGYTYCTELSADEAVAAGATSVAFDHTVVAYTENFLGFPVGLAVPLGYFDRQRALWVAQPNGRVVKIVAVNGGVADVDSDGDGVADDGLGLSSVERQALGATFAAGTSLWRMPTTHFTPIDGNNNIDTTGDTPPAENGAGPDATDPIQKPCQNGGSIIECENQVLGESLAVIGTPYTLDYRSDRVPAQSATKTIRLSGAAVPPTLAGIDMHLAVAGRSFEQSFPASANLATTFTWDRLDAYGRQVVGGQTLAVTIDYRYPAVYQEPGPFPEAFNQTGGTTLALNPSRQQVSVSDHFTTTIGEGLTDARTLGLGGWSLDVHHVYDPIARVLHAGGGRRRRAGSLARLLSTIDLPGKSVLFDVATGPDGSVYVALPHGDEIVRIAPNGTQTVVAGTGVEGVGAEGVSATSSDLGDPTGVAVAADGSILIAEQGNRRVRRVAPNGIITTIAGTGALGTAGDGGPAIQASFTTAERLAVGVDGSVYVVDGGTRIRRITTDGKIQTVAGSGGVGGLGDGGPATSATLNCASVSAAADGGFFIADIFNHRVRRVHPDGTITTVVDYTTDLGQPVSVRPAPDGGLLIALSYATARTPQIDLLRTNGSLVAIAGGGPTPVGNGVPATQANLAAILATALGPDGSIYLVRGGNDSHVVKVSSSFPGFTGDEIVIASEDGTELYLFDQEGRHRRTLLALTGAVLREFGYDAAGRLTSITEKTGAVDDVTTIQHDASGNPTAIVGPFGQTTTLAVDAHGFLASATNPAGEARTFTSSADGLLATLTNPRGKTTTFTYDGDGRLLTDTDPVGGSQTLARTTGVDQFTVTRTTALGHVTTHQVANLPGGVQTRTITDPDGAVRESSEAIDAATVHAVFPDGSTADTMLGPDPRFGMQAPITASSVLDFPTSPTSTLTATRAVALANPQDSLSLTSQTSTVTLAGHTTTTAYDAATKTFTATSPAGRTSTLTIDALGRFVTSQIGTLAAKHATYDAHGRLATLTTGSGGSARALTYTYDAAGFVASITDPVGRTSTLAHDAAGRVTGATLPNGKVVTYGYDPAGNLVSVTPPGRPAHVLAYSDRNELTLVTPPTVPGTGTLAFAADVDQALTTITRSGTDAMTLGYDAFGRPASRTQSVGGPPIVDTFEYDTAGRLSHVASTNGVAIDYTYDGLLSVGETLSGTVAGSVARTYDGALRIATQTVAGTPTIAYGHDADGKITAAGALTLAYDANGLVTTETLGIVSDTAGYDAFGDLASYTASANGAPLYSETLTRDGDGRIVQKVEAIGAGAPSTYVYGYDLVGALATVTKNGAAAESYAYDDAGNRTDATVGGTHVTATTDAQDRLTQYGTASFTYTAAGDLESRSVGAATTSYEYDVLGNLLAVTLPDATVITYVVDGQGRRVGKKVNGTLVQGFLYDDVLRPVAELDGAGTIVSRFVYTGGTVPAYLVKGGTAFRVISDTIGSVRLLVDAATGAVAQRLDYDTFGRVTQDTSPGFQPFGFAGGLYDPDTTLVRFGVRDYDATVGRWTVKDQAGFSGGDPNLYRYALNDPVNLSDPTGLDWIETLAGFGDRLSADINLATNPMLLVDVTVDAAIRAAIGLFGGDPGETLYHQIFTTHSSLVDTKSSDYLDGQFYAQCVDLALAVVDAAGMGISSAASAADRALAQRAARLADEAAQKAAAQAAKGGERAIDRLGRNLREINPERVRVENAVGSTTRGRNLQGGFFTGRGGG